MPAVSSPPPAATPTPLRVAVDLSILLPGGENGGIKPFLFETLLWLGRQQRVPLQFFYLTCARTHAEVRDTLARTHDEVICVRDDVGPLPHGDERAPRERLYLPPPPDLLWQLGVRVLYCPFGPVDFALPGVGTISTIVDVLHRDFPHSLDDHHNADRERVFQEILGVADRLQCISHHVVARMRAHYDVPADRLFTVYIAIHQRFAALAAPTRNSAPSNAAGVASKSAPFFFYPANAWKHKNHETLLLAYGIYRAGALAAGQTPWPLLLTGHEDERWRELRALSETLGLLGHNAVRFRGYVAPHEFGRLWETAGALVFPSLHEGFGIPLLEAMQHDLPVLTQRRGFARRSRRGRLPLRRRPPSRSPRRGDDPPRHRRRPARAPRCGGPPPPARLLARPRIGPFARRLRRTLAERAALPALRARRFSRWLDGA